jgi:hypothetical protein
MDGTGTTAFVWRCGLCGAAYDGAGLSFLLADGSNDRRCTCGGELTEGIGAEFGCCEPALPEYLRGTVLYAKLEWQAWEESRRALAHS